MFSIIWSLLPILIGGVGIVIAANGVIAGFQAFEFQRTHPITHAKVLSVYEETYTEYDSQNNTSFQGTKICAENVRYSMNGRDIQVNVHAMQHCGVQVGDSPQIAYDPKRPSNIQFVPAGDPLWGNVLNIVLSIGIGGFFLMGALGLIFGPSSRIMRIGIFFWLLLVAGMIALTILGAINQGR
ncbi:DUF3592 domain-containing protein [Ktedonospora formicarum]|uniref:DUF3592 domain-containing protein n=1 Tax=Ktedonospora formicarum TaxID=2778364 RepID=A0A8J3I9I7_9CHLR|nr:DUF3592 domain-containing protein [Ktedonospora formicarum]GHO47959.1 hypothetical protein KSX_61220 [Ktedonospora formicarum]